MRISSAFPSKYLKAADLQGRNITVVMDYANMEDVGGGDQKPVLYFQDKTKGLVLNVTNGNIIADVFGDETGSWKGEEIILYEAMVEYKGKMGPAIRVRIPPRKDNGPKQVNRAAPPDDDGIDTDIPF